MRHFMLLTVIALGFASIGMTHQQEKLAGSRDTDAKEIQGVWEGVSAMVHQGGKGGFSCVCEIKDGKMTVMQRDQKSESKYHAFPAKTPCEIDLMPESGVGAGKTLKGIYKIENNTLTICYISGNAKDPEKIMRPTEFDTKKNAEFVLLTFKRQER